MVRRALATALAVAVAAGCSPANAPRALPADRSAPLSYVALGDSTVEGVGASAADKTYVAQLYARLRREYPNARVDNLGVAGATSADVVATQLDRAIALRPDLVTLSIGPNDITGEVPVTEYERHVDAILRRLAGETRALVVVSLLPDLAVTPRFSGRPAAAVVGRLSVDFNEALAKTARRHGARVVDLYAASRREVPQRPELVAGDGYHPSDLGYARWAELMWAEVR
jgi:acyl-CoA thioesterase I